jgi:hypothetical protein
VFGFANAELIGTAELADNISRTAERSIIDAWPETRQCPIRAAGRGVARLNQNIIDVFEAFAAAQRVETDFAQFSLGTKLPGHVQTSCYKPLGFKNRQRKAA